MKRWWLSWYDVGPFTLEWPWWISGYRLDGDEDAGKLDTATICAAVQAPDEAAAREIILACHDTRPERMEWRFVEPRPDSWSPYCDRFPVAKWMRWPQVE